MKNPFSNSQSAYNYGAQQAGQSSLLYSQQGYHMSQAAQQAANQIGNMAGSFQLQQDLYDNMRVQQVENTIITNLVDKEKADLLIKLLHADKDEMFRFKMFFG